MAQVNSNLYGNWQINLLQRLVDQFSCMYARFQRRTVSRKAHKYPFDQNSIMQEQTRAIIHIDLDAFYASVEQRDHPEYRGKPVIVGGSPDRRGVVATASYEARQFGIHSAMPSRTALRLCPSAIFLPARFEVYRAVSQQIMTIFRQHTALVEPLSLDEAFLDVTESVHGLDEAVQLAREIKRQIREQTELTASAGVSYCNFWQKSLPIATNPTG